MAGWNDQDWAQLYPPTMGPGASYDPPAPPEAIAAEPEEDLGVPSYLDLLDKAARAGVALNLSDLA